MQINIGCVSKLNNIVCFRFQAMLCYVILIHVVFVIGSVASKNKKVCRTFQKGLDSGKGLYQSVQESYDGICPPSATKFNVYRVDVHHNQTDILSLLVCWTPAIKKFALQFDGAVKVVDLTVKSGCRLQTCAVTNDTIQYDRKQAKGGGYQLLLTVHSSIHAPYTVRGYFDHRKHHHHHHRKHHPDHGRSPTLLHYKYSPRILPTDSIKRSKRSNTVEIKPLEISECGKSRSCIRYGTNDCGHFDCQYFLSYSVKSDEVEIELSAKTPGWVAVGFSSDSKMGGDEVIACSLDRPLSSTIVAATYTNPYSHDQTKKRDGSSGITVQDSKMRDGYLYCRLKCPTAPHDNLELTNDWYQLYAYGPVSQGGELEKHSITPTASSKKRSLVQKVNIQTSGSPGTGLVTSLYLSIGVIILSVT